ncbi:MAG: hypothetical protein AAF902_05055 [Chloroflexota bacterium]
MSEDNEHDTYRSSDDSSAGGSNNTVLILLAGLLVLILLGAGGFFLFSRDSGGVTSVEDDAMEAVAEVEESGPTADSSLLPADVTPRSSVVVLNDGQLAVNGGVQPADDVYLWDGENWIHVPSLVSGDGQAFIVEDSLMGSQVIVANRAAPANVAVGTDVMAGEAIPIEISPSVGEVALSGLNLAPGGGVTGEAATVPSGGYNQLLHVTNVGAIVDQSSLTELINDPTLQATHIQTLVNAVNSGGQAGVNLDYQGVFPAQEAAYSKFVTDLANALQAAGKTLYVTVDTPIMTGGNFDTGGQNWGAIGAAADGVFLKMPSDPTAWTDDGEAEQLLSWATRRIDRSMLSAIVTTEAIDRFGGIYREMSLEEALGTLGDPAMADGAAVDAGESVAISLAGNASPLEWEGTSRTYTFTYADNGEPRTVWINNESSLAWRLRLVNKYGLRGAMVKRLNSAGNLSGYAAALDSFKANGAMPEPAGAAITWSVEGENGVVASAVNQELGYSWEGTENVGSYMVKATFAQGDIAVDLGSAEVAVGDMSMAEADTETEAVAEESADAGAEIPTEETAEATDETEAAAEDAPAEEVAEEAAPSLEITGNANAVVNVGSNIRNGPGIIYAITNSADPGEQIEIVGRSGDSLWFDIIMLDQENAEGWIYAPLVNVQDSTAVAEFPVTASSAPAAPAAAAPSGGGDDSGGGQQAAVAAAPPPAANLGSFELGGQTHTLGNPSLMTLSGMTWVKFQHKWGCGNNPGDLQGRIDSARANGFKVLLSIPGSPYPSSIDFECYTDFLGGVAALGPDAIEVWNEMNIDFEWPVGSIDPTSYVNNMLKPAYTKIKAANPNVMVISGAPAPTGFFGGGCSASGCDDDAYLRGMAAAGAANFMDCMGVHYNAGATGPSTRSGHPADGGQGHYSWYYGPMIDVYFNSLGRPLCFTELGYLSGQDYGGVPGRFSWAGNTTIDQHAAWLAEAVSIGANSGKVRMIIVFNVDFTLYAEDPQAGFAIRRRDGSCPACGTLAAVMGR